MKDNYRLQEYYKRRLYGDRSALARAVDFVILRAILFVLLFLWFSTRFGVSAPAYALSAVFVLLFWVCSALWSSIRMDECKKHVSEQLVQEMIRERLLLMPGDEFAAMIRAYCRAHREAYANDCMICPMQRSERPGRDVLLCIYRSARRRGCDTVALFCPAPVCEEAEALLKRDDVAIIPQGDAVFSAIAEENGLTPSEEDVRIRILRQIKNEQAERKKSAKPFVLGRVRRYWLVSIVLLAASFFVKYALYYRLMAAVCAFFASVSLWLEREGSARRS